MQMDYRAIEKSVELELLYIVLSVAIVSDTTDANKYVKHMAHRQWIGDISH